MKFEVQPFGYSHHPDLPDVEMGKESIRLVVTELVCSEGTVDLEFHASAMFPDDVATRYYSLREALVLVVNDVDQHDGFAVRTYNSFIRFEHDRTVNLITPPALPLPPRGSLSSEVFQGGYVSGAVSFQAASSVHRPGVFLYLVLENYVSNVVGLDRVDCRAIAL